MRRWHDNHEGLAARIAKVAGAAVFVGAGAMLLMHLDSLRRYFHLRRISVAHPRPPGTLPEGADAPPRWGTTHWPIS